MRTICVGGASSNCGKTSTVVLLAKAFPGWAAVKMTPCRPEAVCPHGNDCGACIPPSGPYEIITDRRLLSAVGKDTAQYLDAGVSRVMWVRSLPELFPQALDAALHELRDVPGVIIESATAISYLDGLNILVLREDSDKIKESARRSIDRIDIVAVNIGALTSFSMPKQIDKLTALIGRPVRIVTMNAMLPPEASENIEFIEMCRKAFNP